MFRLLPQGKGEFLVRRLILTLMGSTPAMTTLSRRAAWLPWLVATIMSLYLSTAVSAEPWRNYQIIEWQPRDPAQFAS